MPFKSINHASWKKLLLFPQHVQVNGLAPITQAYIYNYKQKNKCCWLKWILLTCMFDLHPNFRSRIADFNAESKTSIHHIHKEYWDKVLQVSEVWPTKTRTCVPKWQWQWWNLIMTKKQFNILCHLVIYQDFTMFVLEKVLLNSVEENDNNHRRSIMCFIYWEY